MVDLLPNSSDEFDLSDDKPDNVVSKLENSSVIDSTNNESHKSIDELSHDIYKIQPSDVSLETSIDVIDKFWYDNNSNATSIELNDKSSS